MISSDTPHNASQHDTHQASDAPLRVTVLCGGPSAEREISLQSGQAVADGLRRAGHTVFVADISPDDLKALDHPADVVFPALHGTFGEDGTVQRILAERGIRFVGPDSRASALAMDKVATKSVLSAAGIDTPEFEVWTDATLDARSGPDIALPVMVKPVDQGSSVATSVVREAAEFLPAVRDTISHFGRALVERWIAGDEVTVGIVGPRTLPPVCIRTKHKFYDYHAKYEDDSTEFLFETEYSARVFERVQSLSRRAFDLLGCRHLSRVDWIVDSQERLWFLEVNTLPGFTSHSLVPLAAARVGMNFDQLVDRLVRMAYEESP